MAAQITTAALLTSKKTHRSKQFIWTASVLLLSLSFGVQPTFAQSYYGVIRGLVVDQNQGAVASAKVTIINEGTAEQRDSITNSKGEYVFNEVVPATYSVICEAPGFKRFERKNVIVATQAQVTADVKVGSRAGDGKRPGDGKRSPGGILQRLAGPSARQPETESICPTWAAIRS